MLMSVRDIDILRLCRWCRYVSRTALETVFSIDEVAMLQGLKLIHLHVPSDTFVVTARGNRFLDAHIETLPPAIAPAYHPTDTLRRTRLSHLMLTLYKNGLPIFLKEPAELFQRSGFCLSATTRGRGTNLWGGSRSAGLALLQDRLCNVHYVCPAIGNVTLTEEIRICNQFGFSLGNPEQALIFAGASYPSIITALEEPAENKGTHALSYGEVLAQSPIPVHLLSCDDVGAIQLQIMAQPNYRHRLAQLATGNDFVPPPPDTDWDGQYLGLPFFVAVDMNLKSLDIAVATYDQIAMVALEGQVQILGARYGRKAKVFTLTATALTKFFGHPPETYHPPNRPFLTAKGEMINAPPI